MQTTPPECRCDGSGSYTVSIPLANAVVSDKRPCPVHGQPNDRERALVRDGGRIGEVMDQRQTSQGSRLNLRPPGGGREWVADPARLEPAQQATVPPLDTEPECT